RAGVLDWLLRLRRMAVAIWIGERRGTVMADVPRWAGPDAPDAADLHDLFTRFPISAAIGTFATGEFGNAGGANSPEYAGFTKGLHTGLMWALMAPEWAKAAFEETERANAAYGLPPDTAATESRRRAEAIIRQATAYKELAKAGVEALRQRMGQDPGVPPP
ncbi:MAG: hypothetical protein NTZ05_12305, partial [Chloroflexi bacterium]|nr:hypothetical protein [Chloroflexota bacterium]